MPKPTVQKVTNRRTFPEERAGMKCRGTDANVDRERGPSFVKIDARLIEGRYRKPEFKLSPPGENSERRICVGRDVPVGEDAEVFNGGIFERRFGGGDFTIDGILKIFPNLLIGCQFSW